MSQNFEIEKKFLIEYPDVDYLNSIGTSSEIEQIYLKGEEGKSERIRKRGVRGEYKYYHTIKTPFTAMTREEIEREITESEYENLRKRADESLNIIYKTRYLAKYRGHTLEIDVFPFWKKQAYLEIELASEDEEFFVPDFLKIIRDVTEDKNYTNRALARKIPKE